MTDDTAKRIFIEPRELPEATGDRPLELPPDAEHYVRNVLRLQRGDKIEILNGEGRILDGRIQSIGEHGVKVALNSDRQTARAESSLHIELFQAIPKGDRWKMVLEKSTELGVRRIVPLQTNRTVVEIPEGRRASKMDRWRRIVGNATRQCGRSHTPEIVQPAPIERAQDRHGGADIEVLLDPKGDESFHDHLNTEFDRDDDPRVALWIGPEGGFTDRERRVLHTRDVVPVTFGPRVLRSETAGIAAVTAAQLILGDL